MSRLLDEQAVVDMLSKYYGYRTDAEQYPLRELLSRLPSTQAEQRWNPVKTRPLTEEERQYCSEFFGYDLEDDDAVLFDCKMPVDGQEIWVCSKCGNVWQDTCVVDEGIGLEENGDWSDIVAWMPFYRPEPYKGET